MEPRPLASSDEQKVRKTEALLSLVSSCKLRYALQRPPLRPLEETGDLERINTGDLDWHEISI